MADLEVYHRLETPKIWAAFGTQTFGDDGTLSGFTLDDPDTSIQIIIEDSTGTVVQALTDMTKSATGKYYYQCYTIPSTANLGIWNYDCVGTDASGVSIGGGSFEVVEQVA